jgi:mannuronan 5-epimerase
VVTRSSSRSTTTKVIALTVLAFFVAGLTTVLYGAQAKGLTAYPQVAPRPPYVRAISPIDSDMAGFAPNSTLANPGQPENAVRVVAVYPGRVELLAGGRAVSQTVGSVATLPELAALVHRSSWLACDSAGTCTLSAAVVLEQGTKLAITGGSVRLGGEPGVLLGLNGATLVADHARITSLDPGAAYRPFIDAENTSHLVLSNSTVSGLGRDWNQSYGVSWMSGSTGSARATTFEDNFIGVYTDHAHNLTFSGDTFAHNALYGLDPHSYSSGLVISDNRALDNARHGIIFSNHVTNSVVRDNVSSGNGENGIMMDEYSTGNVISGNQVIANRGYGIVLSHSAANVVRDNVVKYNLVGIELNGGSAGTAVVRSNSIIGNEVALQGLNKSAGNLNSITAMSSQWRTWLIVPLWSLFIVLVVLTAALWATDRRRNVPFGRPGPKVLAA